MSNFTRLDLLAKTATVMVMLLALTTITGCQTSNVVVDYDTEASFDGTQYYQWLEARSGADKQLSPLLLDRTKAALVSELANAGFKPANEVNAANILVRYYVSAITRTEEPKSAGSVGFGNFGGSSAVGLSMSFPLGKDKVVQETQIMVDLLNMETEKLKWRGSKELKISAETPEEITALINSAVKEIFGF
jgi:hypothetical protein